jgi:hypothetical protein
VLSQEKYSVAKHYQVFATPFAFLIDEQGTIRSKGTIAMRQHLSYVLSCAGQSGRHEVTRESEASERAAIAGILSPRFDSTEASHV